MKHNPGHGESVQNPETEIVLKLSGQLLFGCRLGSSLNLPVFTKSRGILYAGTYELDLKVFLLCVLLSPDICDS